MKYKKIAIVTPVKNEVGNLPKIIDSIKSQSHRIALWLVLENDSDDGSKEYLDEIEQLDNVDKFLVLNLDLPNKEYQLGFKYSTIMKHGFDYIIEKFGRETYDYIGILDADCFPEKDYYQKLIKEFERDDSIGILSGQTYTYEGNKQPNTIKEPRGNSRLWKMQCFLDAGYYIAMSADSVSYVKAKLKGWKGYSIPTAVVYSRDIGNRLKNHEYYGRSAHYRGFTLSYVFIKSLYYTFFKFKFNFSYGLLVGYLKSMFEKKEKIQDKDILTYHSNKLFKLFKK